MAAEASRGSTAHGPGLDRWPGAAAAAAGRRRTGLAVPSGPHAARVFSEADKQRAVLRQQLSVEDDRRRHHLAAHQPRSDAQDVRICRRASASTPTRRRSTQRGVIYTIGPSPRYPIASVDRHRRRADSHDRRRRAALERRDAAADWAVVEGVHDRRRPLRRADGVRGGQHAAPRRHASAPLSHARRRQDVDGDRDWPRGRGPGQRDSRGSEEEGTAVREHRARRLRVVRRRRSLAIAAAQHAGIVRARHHREGRRPRRGHARPRLLDSR